MKIRINTPIFNKGINYQLDDYKREENRYKRYLQRIKKTASMQLKPDKEKDSDVNIQSESSFDRRI